MNNEKPTYQALADELSNLKKENESLKLALSLHDNSEALIANIGDVIGIIGADGIMKYKSPNIEKYFGWMPADLIGTDGLHTVHPDDVERIQNEFAKLIINNNALTTVEYRYKCKNGTYKWIELTAVNNINNPGINGVLLNYHDITERKHAEEVLAQEKAFVEAIFESIPGMLYVYDDKGTHIRHNKRHEEMTGYSDEELSHMNPLIWYDNKADVVRVEAAINDVFTKGYGEVDVPMRIKNGEKPIMHFTGSLLIKDSKKYFVGVGIDITERKQTEEKLKSSDRIFLHSLDMLCIAGFDGYFKVLNPAWEKTLGWSNDELLKNPWLEFVHPDDRNATENIKSVIVEGKEIYQFENKFICKDGGIKWLSWNSFPYPEDGIMFGVARDVTVLKQIEIELIKSKDKAEESEQTFRALFEKGPIGVAYHKMIYDEACLPINYLFLAANESYQKLTGVNPNGKLVTEAFPGIENDPFNWIGTFGEVAKTGREIRFQQYLQPNHRWYDCVGYQYKPDHFVAAFLEITEQKRAENELQENQSQLNAQNEEYLVINEELQEQNNEYAALNEEYITQNEDLLIAKEEAERNEKKYRSLFVSMQEGVYLHEMVYDNQGKAINYRIIEANPVSEKCLNIKREYAIGKLATELFGTAEAPFIEIYSKVAETGEPYQFEQYFEPMNKYFYVSVFSPKKGEFATAFLDITKSKDYENDLVKAKEKAEESENRLKLASRSGKLGIWDWNVKDNIMIWDEKMFELYGITHDAFPSNIEAWTNGLHPDDKQRAIDECNAALNGEKDFNTSFRIVQPNGIIIHLKADGIVIRDIDNKPLRMIGINQDISELKKAEYELIIAKEKAEESDRLKTAFLQNMSHEIRTPMNAIMGFSELLVKNFNNKPKLEQFSGIIKQRSNDLLDIINDLLDIAKIESGQLQVSIENCNVTSLFSELKMFFTEYQARMNKQHISFDLLAHCNLQGITISTDKVKLRQIIINLLTNAFKFTPKGKIEGGCRVDENQQLIFYVSDTGIGIPQDKHEYIFERFSQLENGNSRLFGGTGLGLPIVKGLVDLLGGKIWFDSDPDKGTTFFFTIAYSNQALKMPLVNDDSVPDTLNFHNNTILIVEDDQFNMALIEEMLSDLGLYILCAENGSQAIEIALSQTPELILMDIGLPDMSGYEAIRQILLKQPTMKIVAQTAYATATDRDTAINSGCIDYISKPLKAQKLLSLINKYLG